MELKDVILSTLAEIEEITMTSSAIEEFIEHPVITNNENSPSFRNDDAENEPEFRSVRDDEARMLEGIRERLLVLFEGFQSPNNAQIEAKVDLTLNFFEYLLATIDNRLETIKK